MRPVDSVSKYFACAVLIFFLFALVTEAAARRGGGRGGGRGHRGGGIQHSRVGPASGGSFTSRPAHRQAGRTAPARATSPEVRRETPRPLPAVPPEERQERREERREKRQERREEIGDDHWDDWRYRRHQVVVGTVYTTDDFDPADCEATVVVEGTTYYQCDGVWYQRVYDGGSVTYVAVDSPR